MERASAKMANWYRMMNVEFGIGKGGVSEIVFMN